MDRSLLQAFVPLNALEGEALERLLAIQQVDVHAAGTDLLTLSGRTLYLLQGEVLRDQGDGGCHRFGAGDARSWHPLVGADCRQLKALSAVTVLSFDSEQLDAVLSWSEAQTTLAITDQPAVGRGGLLQCLSGKQRAELLRHARSIAMPAGASVVAEGDPADSFYLIQSGRCTVQADGALVAELGGGDSFGEEGLLNQLPRNASVTMATDGVLLVWSQQDFERLLKQSLVVELAAAEAEHAVTQGARWLDVRTFDEFGTGALPGALHVPLSQLRQKTPLLESDRPYLVYCDTGRRSTTAVFLLRQAGLNARLLRGGLMARQ